MTTTTLDAPAEVAAFIRNSAGLYGRDLDAISDEDYTKPMGGQCRTAHEFTVEIVGFNRHIANQLRGIEAVPLTDEQKAERSAKLSDRAAGKAAVIESADELAQAVVDHPENLSKETMAPWKAPMSLFTLVLIGMSHIMYHDGQLNFLQSFRGDDQMHWFD